jgi:hypothetical protein
LVPIATGLVALVLVVIEGVLKLEDVPNSFTEFEREWVVKSPASVPKAAQIELTPLAKAIFGGVMVGVPEVIWYAQLTVVPAVPVIVGRVPV